MAFWTKAKLPPVTSFRKTGDLYNSGAGQVLVAADAVIQYSIRTVYMSCSAQLNITIKDSDDAIVWGPSYHGVDGGECTPAFEKGEVLVAAGKGLKVVASAADNATVNIGVYQVTSS